MLCTYNLVSVNNDSYIVVIHTFIIYMFMLQSSNCYNFNFSISICTRRYKSFSRSADNIGDITAKGEAQLAVVDLLGMFVGIYLSKAVDAARLKIAVMFVILTILDLLCIFKEVQR